MGGKKKKSEASVGWEYGGETTLRLKSNVGSDGRVWTSREVQMPTISTHKRVRDGEKKGRKLAVMWVGGVDDRASYGIAITRRWPPTPQPGGGGGAGKTQRFQRSGKRTDKAFRHRVLARALANRKMGSPDAPSPTENMHVADAPHTTSVG